MLTAKLLPAAILLLAVSSFPAKAQKTDWKTQLAGLDGVALSCIDHSDGNYGKKLCKGYLDRMESEMKKAGIPTVRQGFFRFDEEEPGKPEEFETPLNLRLFIRGTSGGTVAIQLRSRASVRYTAAVEKGSGGAGRSGELVLWEKSATGSGPSGELQGAIVEAMISRTAAVLKNINASWPGR